MQKTKNPFMFFLAICLIMLSACSGLYPYKNTTENNLFIRTTTSSGSFLTRVKARVDIYAVDDACKISYQGSVDLDKKQVPIGIGYDRPVFLDFVFSSSNFLANSKGATSFDVYLTPRSRHEYLAEVSYLKGIYDVIIKEKKGGSNVTKELELKECQPKR